jgi:hypothetical protein
VAAGQKEHGDLGGRLLVAIKSPPTRLRNWSRWRTTPFHSVEYAKNFARDYAEFRKEVPGASGGGAHPNQFSLFETYDLRSGKLLALADILKEDAREPLRRFVEQEVRKLRGTAIEPGQLHLPDAFGLLTEGLVIRYGDIGPPTMRGTIRRCGFRWSGCGSLCGKGIWSRRGDGDRRNGRCRPVTDQSCRHHRCLFNTSD